MNEFIDILLFIGLMLGVGVVIIGLIFTPMFLLTKTSCYKTAEKMGVEATHDIWSECMIKWNGKWVPISKLRIVD